MPRHVVPGEPLVGLRPVTGGGAVTRDLERLFVEQRLHLTRLAAAVTLDRAVAEEVVQEAFLGLHRHAGTVDNPVAYLRRSVVNLALKVLRRRRVERRRPVPPPASVGIPEIDETWSAVCALSARHRSVVVLRFWADLSEAEIAATLGWPAGTVKSTLHRALKQLKEAIEP